MPTIKEQLEAHEKRLAAIEKYLDLDVTESAIDEKSSDVAVEAHEASKIVAKKSSDIPVDEEEGIDVSFGQVVTVLGIIGIIIGAISFYFYAVANQWIGQGGQLTTGFITGFILFFVAYMLQSKNESWSYVVFGGSYFISYLTIGVGTMYFELIPNEIGLLLAILYLVSSLALTVKFNSRVIGYFTIAGGFLIPFFTGMGDNDLFLMVYFLTLSIGLLVLSYYKNWSDLRLTSFIIQSLFIMGYAFKLVTIEAAIFIILFFLVFNVSSLLNAVRKENTIPVCDAVTFGLLPIFYLPLLYNALEESMGIGSQLFGLIVLGVSVLYLVQILVIRSMFETVDDSIVYTILSAAFILLNIGIFMLLGDIVPEFMFVVFTGQLLLYLYLSTNSPLKDFYSVCSYVAVFLSLIPLISISFFQFSRLLSIFFMTYILLLFIILYVFHIKQIGTPLVTYIFGIGLFIVLFVLSRFVGIFVDSEQFIQVLLSVLWLIYSLIVLRVIKENTLGVIMLVITLLKIVFIDLSYLEGAFRILGFIIFGILLLIGGYFLRK